jgi:cytochrome c553
MKLSFIRILCAESLVVLAACNSEIKVEQQQTLPELKGEELIARGKYLTTIGACNDCHSPKMMTPHGPEPDTSRLLSGHPQSEAIPAITGKSDWILFSPGITAFAGPWGVSYAANLTPDDTGIGNWTFEQFQTAIRQGKYKGLKESRPLMPPMPWQMYRNFSDEDLKAVYAYLKSIKPVNNLVPAYTPPKQ